MGKQSKLTESSMSRRGFLRVGAGSGAALAIAGVPSTAMPSASPLQKNEEIASGWLGRQQVAQKIRIDAAKSYSAANVDASHSNGDETRYTDQRGSFAKTLPHNDDGLPDPKAYAEFVSILTSGDPSRFEQFPRDAKAQSKLSNPLAGYALEMVGVDAQAIALPAPPAFASAEMAFEMAELYWQALTTDVPYRDYENNPLIVAAARDLNACSTKTAPLANGKMTPQTLFRGETAGDLVGPYISQFLLMDIPYGIKTIDQRYTLPSLGQSFMTTRAEWVACQRGVRPTAKISFATTGRFICNSHDLSEWVHGDFNFQASLNAALIMQKWGEEAISVTNPYRASKTQSGGVTMGREVLGLLAQLTSAAQKACYFQKWQVHRRVRPEAFGGRLDNHLSGRAAYDIHPDLLDCDGVGRSFAAQGSRLLPLQYPEGCPAHPSYPAGHATNAGAGVTILKAFFNEAFAVPKAIQTNADGSKVEPYSGPALTLGNELNKLANNISIGRDAGGVHFRSDGIQGMRLGETVAISVLRDYSRTYRERFDGFVLTMFSGKRIKIVDGAVLSL
jgi:hypothetical protein